MNSVCSEAAAALSGFASFLSAPVGSNLLLDTDNDGESVLLEDYSNNVATTSYDLYSYEDTEVASVASIPDTDPPLLMIEKSMVGVLTLCQ
jgi:hypothetical protein